MSLGWKCRETFSSSDLLIIGILGPENSFLEKIQQVMFASADKTEDFCR